MAHEQKMPNEERREFIRLNASVDVQYTILEKTSPSGGAGVSSRNISAGGLCLIVYEDVPVGSLLALSVYFPDLDFPIICKGKVAWSKAFAVADEEKKRYDIGVEFVDISDEDRQKINQCVLSFKKVK